VLPIPRLGKIGPTTFSIREIGSDVRTDGKERESAEDGGADRPITATAHSKHAMKSLVKAS